MLPSEQGRLDVARRRSQWKKYQDRLDPSRLVLIDETWAKTNMARTGPINGEHFLAYVEQLLVPTLAPGDIVILDNLGSPKSPAIRKAIRAVGAKLF